MAQSLELHGVAGVPIHRQNLGKPSYVSLPRIDYTADEESRIRN
jgi:hypothetical protein